MMKLLSFLLILAVGLTLLPAQGNLRIERRYAPDQEQSQEMVFLYYTYQSSILDLSHFRRNFPESRPYVEEKVSVIPPNVDKFEDVVYGVTFIQKNEDRPGVVIILLIRNYHSSQPVYYLDKNMDGDYSDDGVYFIFSDTEKTKTLEFANPALDLEPYKIQLLNPNYHKEVKTKAAKPEVYVIPDEDDAEAQRYFQIADQLRSENHVELRASLIIGFGGIRYSFNDPSTNYPTDYKVNFNTKGLGLQVNYAIKRFKIGVEASYEDLWYWTSKKDEKLGEPYEVCFDTYCIFRENIQKSFNQDLMPDGRFSYGLRLEYDFPISQMSYLSPVLSLSAYQYIGKRSVYIPDRYQAPDQSYSLGLRSSLGLGALFTTDITGRSSFFFSVMMKSLSFNPEGYFESISAINLYRYKAQVTIGLGYQVKFN